MLGQSNCRMAHTLQTAHSDNHASLAGPPTCDMARPGRRRSPSSSLPSSSMLDCGQEARAGRQQSSASSAW